jgi:amidohydrolase
VKETIRRLCKDLEPGIVRMRRELHAIPEPSFGEHKTGARLASYLKRAGIEHSVGIAKTGVVGLVTGSGRRTVALRSDMDALNIGEKTGLPFASRHPGFMHACGHDSHMAMVLGAGVVLKRLGRRLPGNVKLIFQPAEESPPVGAKAMIREGVLRSPRVHAAIGLHVDPSIRSGRVAVNPGPISASADDFRITVLGKGGHGSSPHKTVDAVVVAADLVMSLQTIVSRRVSPLDSVVVSVGKLESGERDNIIAETAHLEGTFRTKSKTMRKRVRAMIRQITRSVCAAHGAKGRFEYVEGYPPVVCDPKLSALVFDACSEMLGRPNVTTSPGLEMGGEDFAYFAEAVPGTTVFVGVGNRAKGKTYHLHQSRFDIDEDALKTGTMALANSAYRYLEK